jgi:GNAT superfamily N-acetyltransferase
VDAEIREYQDSDYHACRALWVELTQHHRDIYDDESIGGDDPGAELDAHLKDTKRAITWVAEEDGTAYGGVGTALLQTAIEEAKSRGMRSLSIQPVARNVDAMRLYRRLGFHILGHIDMTLDLKSGSDRKWKSGIAIHGEEYAY